VSIGPRSDYPRIEQSRALPPLDDLAVWATPVCMCIQPSAARASRSRCCERRCACVSARRPGRGGLSA
jgi:hypothetical protein